MADLENTLNNDGNVDVNQNNDGNDNNNSDNKNTPTIEELMAKIATLETANKKQKATIDKMSSAEAERKREERAKMTADQQAEIARLEEEETRKQYISDLENFRHKTEAKDRYLLQGMSIELAEKAAEAELNNDMDSLSAIQKQHSDGILKNARAEWLKSRPDINAGTGEKLLSKEEFDKLGAVEKTALKRSNPKEYERLRKLV